MFRKTASVLLFALIFILPIAAQSIQDWSGAYGTAERMLASSNNGIHGFYLKEVDGPVFLAKNIDTVFEPASSIKIVHLLQTFLKIHDGTLSLYGPFDWYMGAGFKDDPATPEMDEREYGCPSESEPAVWPLIDGLRAMMENSDNRWTQAVRVYFGDDVLNAAARSLGAVNTLLAHRIGCAFPTEGDPGLLDAPNHTTLRDLSILYEKAFSQLLTESEREVMLDLMNNDMLLRLDEIIGEEAAAAGASPRGVTMFRQALLLAWKPGKYNVYDLKLQSVGGIARIPFMTGGSRSYRTFFFGLFVDRATLFPEQGTRETLFALKAASEMLRPLVRASLLSFSK